MSRARPPAKRRHEIKIVGRRAVSTARKYPFVEKTVRLPRKRQRQSASMTVNKFRSLIARAKVLGEKNIPLGKENYVSLEKAEFYLLAIIKMMRLKDSQTVTFTPKTIFDPTVEDYILTA